MSPLAGLAHTPTPTPTTTAIRTATATSIRDSGIANVETKQDIAEAVLDAEVRIGELMAQVPKASHDRGNQYTGGKGTAVSHSQTKASVIEQAGFTPKQVQRFEQLAKELGVGNPGTTLTTIHP